MRLGISLTLIVVLIVVIVLARKRQVKLKAAKKKPSIVASLKGKVVVHSATAIPKNKVVDEPEPEQTPQDIVGGLFENLSDKDYRNCVIKCSIKHPFNKQKRLDCVESC